jgi:hypothetical protein
MVMKILNDRTKTKCLRVVRISENRFFELDVKLQIKFDDDTENSSRSQVRKISFQEFESQVLRIREISTIKSSSKTLEVHLGVFEVKLLFKFMKSK